MRTKSLHLLLADDDEDDCLFFCEALECMKPFPTLDVVHDGVELMQFLQRNKTRLPHVLFLDLNMPRKNGFECLDEIKSNSHLKLLPVIIFSTSYDRKMINMLYQNGAQHYIRKPAELCKLRELLQQAITITIREKFIQPAQENFVLASN